MCIPDKTEESKGNLLEQYKLFVEMADRISSRRATSNQFYVALLSGLLAVAAFILKERVISTNQNIVLLILAILGMIICIFWSLNIFSYRQLNSGKFEVIHEMEKLLPFHCYDREWEILGKGRDCRKYLPLIHIEIYIPITIFIVYFVLLVYVIIILRS